MMVYIKLILKKLRKDKFNVLPFLFITAFIAFIYVGSYTSAYQMITDPMFSGEAEIDVLKNDVLMFQNELDSFDASSEDYKISNENLSMAQNRLKYTQNRFDAIQKKNWNEYFKNDLALTNITLGVLENDSEYYDKETIGILNMNCKYNEYMVHHNLAFDDRFSPVQGVSFMSDIVNRFLPIILAVVLIYMSSNMYCSTYVENIDTQNLLPYSRIKKQGTRLFAGLILGIFISLFIFGLSMLCGTLGSSFGSFDTPFLIFTLDGADAYLPFISMIPQFTILLLLAILFIVNFVSVIARITRKNMVCLLVSSAFLVGFLVIAQELAPLQDYMHLLPTTYINSFKVVSGELAFITNNANVNVMNGIIVLVIANTLLISIYYSLSNKHVRSVETK